MDRTKILLEEKDMPQCWYNILADLPTPLPPPIHPAPESAHAIKCTIDEAKKAKDAGEEKAILFNLSGHGYLDMSAYDNYLAGKLEDYEYSQEDVDEAMKSVPKIAGR